MLLSYFMMFLLKNMINHLNWLPTNKNISFFWNLGSMLGIVLIIQLFTGLILSLLFTPSVYSFWILINLTEEINMVLFLRWVHSNGASLFFIFIFLHMARGIYYYSFNKKLVWLSGVTIYIILMAAAFLGYVLPWGQMSLWGGTVITNLFSVISENFVIWIWGNFSVSGPTLSLFFTLHFLIPFILLGFVVVHILCLHETGSSSKMFISNLKNKFSDFYLLKDFVNIIIVILFFGMIFISPWVLGDSENFIEANQLLSPVHIKPEWYFLWAYAILRAIPSKIGGVLSLLMGVVILYFVILKNKMFFFKKMNFIFYSVFILLTILGGCAVEYPFIFLSQLFSFMYFFVIMLFYVL